MSQIESARERASNAELRVVAAAPTGRLPRKAPTRWAPVLITVAAVVIAGLSGWGMWRLYMETPWTRDATVRAYVVTMAPEVEGHIVELPLADNQFVRKGDLLILVDPTNYRIAVSQAEAHLRQAQANSQDIDAQIAVQDAQIAANRARVQRAQAALVFAQEQAARYRDLAHKGFGSVQNAQQYVSQLEQQQSALESAQAVLRVAERQIEVLRAQHGSAEATVAQATSQRDQARVNLERTQIRSPVNGWVTNLLAQLGDYASVGRNVVSIVDADSFWVDAYFEETEIASLKEGDPAQIKLMGYSQIVRGEVGSVARAINVSNAQPDQQGLATVNPIFTWVRLAQRVPVRIRIGRVPDGVRLVAGMTATVEIDPR
jgi:multidrug resistance efflux pump